MMAKYVEFTTQLVGLIKLTGALAVFVIVWFCPLPRPAFAASKYDGSAPFVCVPTAVAQCIADGECQPDTAAGHNLPDFFKIDLKARTVLAEDEGRLSRIKQIDRAAGLIVLYGSDVERPWVLMIREKTGKMSASVTGDGESFVIFGVCPVP